MNSILLPLKWFHNLPDEFKRGSTILFFFSLLETVFFLNSERLHKGRPGVLVEVFSYMNSILLL